MPFHRKGIKIAPFQKHKIYLLVKGQSLMGYEIIKPYVSFKTYALFLLTTPTANPITATTKTIRGRLLVSPVFGAVAVAVVVVVEVAVVLVVDEVSVLVVADASFTFA